jgi:hypothetical protein
VVSGRGAGAPEEAVGLGIVEEVEDSDDKATFSCWAAVWALVVVAASESESGRSDGLRVPPVLGVPEACCRLVLVLTVNCSILAAVIMSFRVSNASSTSVSVEFCICTVRLELVSGAVVVVVVAVVVGTGSWFSSTSWLLVCSVWRLVSAFGSALTSCWFSTVAELASIGSVFEEAGKPSDVDIVGFGLAPIDVAAVAAYVKMMLLLESFGEALLSASSSTRFGSLQRLVGIGSPFELK